MTRPLVLLANDDGFRARGIRTLFAALKNHVDVVMCAPDSEQSAASHALSLHRPLRLVEREAGVFSVDGTPADCVYVAMHSGRVLARRPDLVVSGMNHGVNLGYDVFYSGTVAAAREAALKGLPALAVSAGERADMTAACELAARLAVAMIDAGVDQPVVMNANFPSGSKWAVRGTTLGSRVYRDSVEFRKDPRGREYLWIGGAGVSHNTAPGSDTDAYDRGEVGVTPLVLDLWADEHAAAIERVLSRLKP